MCDKKEEEKPKEEPIKFESKVVFALGRLQPGCRLMSCSHNCTGVSSQALYEYIKDQHPELDGDIESQVITALQSCVRSGIICALCDGKYRLIGPNPKGMVASCTRRLTHGPRCCCLALVNCMTKNLGKGCCNFSFDYTPIKLKCNKEIQTSGSTSDANGKNGNKCPSKRNLKRKLEVDSKKDEEEKNKTCKKNSKNSVGNGKSKNIVKGSDQEEKNKNCNKNLKDEKKDGDAKNKDDSKCITKKSSDTSSNTKSTKKKVEFGKKTAKRKKFCSSCGKIRTLYLASKGKFLNY